MGPTRTSGTGDAGFTLLEVLLALAVIGLIAVVLIAGSTRMLAGRPVTPDEIFWDAVHRARKLALEKDRDVFLSYDDKNGDFAISNGSTTKTVALPVVPPGFGVAFIPANTALQENLVAGVLVASQTLPSVSFFPDGTCTPFEVQFHSTAGSHMIAIDPWTCAKMPPPLNPDGTPAAPPS